jgi:hypothetical protein
LGGSCHRCGADVCCGAAALPGVDEFRQLGLWWVQAIRGPGFWASGFVHNLDPILFFSLSVNFGFSFLES